MSLSERLSSKTKQELANFSSTDDKCVNHISIDKYYVTNIALIGITFVAWYFANYDFVMDYLNKIKILSIR